jgi:uncharacterized protein (TIGR02118 family)
MIKRTSLVWRRPDISETEFRNAWLGEHVHYARQLPGLREYVIDFVTEGPSEGPAGIATLRFDSREALDAAFSDRSLSSDLMRTREQFARAVQVMLVDEHIVVPRHRQDMR